MDTESAYLKIVSGARHGLTAGLARLALSAMSLPYRLAVSARNLWYDSPLFVPVWMDVPVISVGNLTVGGTGKTPMTIWLCERLLQRGHKPAVLSRGYKASATGFADEAALVARRCPQAVAIANPDRRASGELAISAYGVEAIVLDDGFQHRRLGHDLDVVLIDATRPFGFERLLPRGLLREPLKGLRRAEVVVLTRCDQATPDELDAIEARVRTLSPKALTLRSTHTPAGFTDLGGGVMSQQPSGRIGAFAGVARPDAFEATLRSLGMDIAGCRWYPDHHPFTPADIAGLGEWARRIKLDALVTTEKDAVRLANMNAELSVPTAALRINMRFEGDGAERFCARLDAMLADHQEEPDEQQSEPV